MNTIEFEHLKNISLQMKDVMNTEIEGSDKTLDSTGAHERLANLAYERDELVTDFLFHVY